MINLEGLSRSERLQGLSALKEYEPRLSFTVADYRDVNIPDGATVYADPPYRNTGEHYGGFDFEAFDDWLGKVSFPVYVSEYDAPRGCAVIAEHARTGTMAANRNDRECIERLFVQERFRK